MKAFRNLFLIPNLLIIVLTLSACGEVQNLPDNKNDAVKVDVIELKSITYQPSVELPGRVSAIKESEVRPQVSGIIKSRLFTDGKDVKEGDVLYQIDPAIYQANVNNAQASVKKAQADQKVAKKTLLRYEKLAKNNVASQQDLDDAEASYEQASAEVNVTQANLDYNNILLSYSQVKAPISGRIGISTVSEGALVTAEQSSYLTTIKQFDSVYVDMTQSSLALQKIRKELIGQEKKDDIDVPVTIKLEDGSAYPLKGYLESLDITVDQSTSSVTLRAIMPNPTLELLPGIFVRATIMGPVMQNIKLLPQSVIIRSQNGAPYVYVVNENNQAVKKDVVLGQEIGTQWEIKQGLTDGDKVIINSFLQLKDGVAVVIDQTSTSDQ
ncbi:efflux RND transporter periplasmic adaptor subunit [Pseudoalteromonas sp. AOP31-A2-14]|uniref:efflux RND transporter periplasmic adaptor subunit n=1 Tax=unclassified Pseudoalteromonas TaxID=194690 RepID=UPI003F97F2B5